MIDMHPGNGLTGTAIANVGGPGNALAYGVIKDEYPLRAGRGFDQPLGFRIVDILDLVFVIEVVHHALLPNQSKPLAIERYRLADREDIMDRQTMRLRHDVRSGFASRRLKGVGSWPARGGRQIVEIGRYERQGGDL